MVEFLTTNSVSHHIDTILQKAREHIILVSPYLKISSNFAQRLQDADRRGTDIVIIYGKKEALAPEVEAVLRTLDNLHLRFFKNNHSKCYLNEQKVVITSMNLHEYSQRNNREMGVLATNDEQVYKHALSEIESIIDHSAEKNLPKTSAGSSLISKLTSAFSKNSNDASKASKTGNCIRCGDKVTHNPETPYCRSCFRIWKRWEDPTYEEEICHTCGKEASTSMEKPQCYSCYKSTVAA